MQIVEYHEPDKHGNDVTVQLTIDEAIRRAKRVAVLHAYTYRSDREALDDFLTVHWASVVDAE
jgi:hypothetical protein